MFKSRRSPSEGGDAGAPPDLLAGPRHEAALRGGGGREERLARGAPGATPAASQAGVDAVAADAVVRSQWP